MLAGIVQGAIGILSSSGWEGRAARKLAAAGVKKFVKSDMVKEVGARIITSVSAHPPRSVTSQNDSVNSLNNQVCLESCASSQSSATGIYADDGISESDRDELFALVKDQFELRKALREGAESEVLDIQDRVESLRCRIKDNGVLDSLSVVAKNRLEALDREKRTVGGCLCSSIEEAVRSAEARPKVDEVFAKYSKLSSETMPSLAQDLAAPCFATEYGNFVKNKLCDRTVVYADIRCKELACNSAIAESALVSLRKELSDLENVFGQKPFDRFSKRVGDRLAALDREARTVNGHLCSTRVDAEVMRREIPIVDSIVADKLAFPLDAVDGMLSELHKANLVSDYARNAIRHLEERRAYMLTVDGVAYPTLEEAERAFQAACGTVGKFFAYQIAYGNKKGSRSILAAKHWPGSLPPESVMAKFNNGDLVGAAKRLGSVAIPGIAESYVDAFEDVKGFFKRNKG